MKRFRGGLIFQAHKLLYHSTLGSKVKKKKEKSVRSKGCGRGLWEVSGAGIDSKCEDAKVWGSNFQGMWLWRPEWLFFPFPYRDIRGGVVPVKSLQRACEGRRGEEQFQPAHMDRRVFRILTES